LSPEIAKSVGQLDFSLAEWDRNPRIATLLSKTVLKGGKRLRPLMTFMVADLFQLNHAEVAPYARFVELVHASTLAHDDVVDNADVRRGEASINAVASNKTAVLAGDYLLAYVLQEIASTGRNDLVIEMARIIADLAEGEWLQIENGNAAHLKWTDIESVALHKTGSVLRWSFSAPALLSNMDAPFIQKCRRLGEAVGIAFQLTDDILDFVRTDGAEGADVKNRVINAVIFEALALKYQTEMLDMSSIHDLDISETLDTAVLKVRARVDNLVKECHELLHEIADEFERKRGIRVESAISSLDTMINFLAQRI
jgi:geranylgeranyl pyrophosphate synthase